MKWIPSLRLAISDADVLPASGRIGNRLSDMITATKENPLNVKHHAAPRLVSAIPPNIGPMTRARLN